jgi:hypothetical protein
VIPMYLVWMSIAAICTVVVCEAFGVFRTDLQDAPDDITDLIEDRAVRGE